MLEKRDGRPHLNNLLRLTYIGFDIGVDIAFRH